MKATVYSTTRCPYCVMLKNFLLEQNISFNEVNVETNPEIMQKLIAATGQMGVPQTEINGNWVIGYDPETIMKVIQN
ncbi:glutaredoxin family protein [Cytobacillus dafuensis]|uniref:Glutaredoxin family protein n=1 Tax=Cytobacillus dafuensis TaxID=1742359 RepID=A0A5B8Z8W2_CYTDA|nr:glutaredoxin family protein [Cytobacillus dafuensis]QED49297.1 glutaredoxin family protein [Cytobacillus dafuensis]